MKLDRAKRRPHALVVAYCFPPHGAIGTMRTLRVVREMCARGWEVTVLTGAPETYLSNTPVDLPLLEQVPLGVRVLRVRAIRPWNRLQRIITSRLRRREKSSKPQAPGSASASRTRGLAAQISDVVDAALSIPDRESGWLLPAVAAGVRRDLRASSPDVIYSSAPPWTGHLVAAGLKRLLRCPWVADCRDPWSRAPWRGDRYGFALSAAATLERLVVRSANRLVFVTHANHGEFAKVYGSSAALRFSVVPNGCDPAEFDRLRPYDPPRTGPFVLLHTGSLYAGRTPMPLLKAIGRAIADGSIRRDQIKARFLGVNALTGVDLAAACSDLGLDGVVEFLPRVPREESLRAMVDASALLLLQPGHTASVPGKLYEYLAVGRPIIAVAEEGEISEILRRTGAGISVPSEDEEGLARALAEQIRRRHDPMPVTERAFYDGNIGAAKIADILEAALGCHLSPSTWSPSTEASHVRANHGAEAEQ